LTLSIPWSDMGGGRLRSIAPFIHNLRSIWRWAINLTPRPLYHLKKKTGTNWTRWLDSRAVWTIERWKHLSRCTGIWNPDLPACSLFAIPSELHLKCCKVNTLINNALKITVHFADDPIRLTKSTNTSVMMKHAQHISTGLHILIKKRIRSIGEHMKVRCGGQGIYTWAHQGVRQNGLNAASNNDQCRDSFS
jgi:hypothetical protein